MPRKKKRLYLAREEDKELIARQSVAASKFKKQQKQGKLGRMAEKTTTGKNKKKGGRFEAEISK